MSETTRRGVLAGAAGVGAAAALAACGTSTDNSNAGSNGGGQAAPTTAGAATGGSTGGANNGGTALAKTSEIPVGGGKVFKAEHVVVTQPEAGQYKAFTSICTHMGCDVNTVSDNVIGCPCHQSKFSAADGSVKGGPAPSGLAAKNITVSGDNITLA